MKNTFTLLHSVCMVVVLSLLSGCSSEEHREGIVLEEFLYEQADFPSCHSVTIVELENGDLLATYFGGTHERHPDVEIRLQRKTPGGQWSAPQSVATVIQNDTLRYPTWNPVIFQPDGGELMLYYKVGPSPKEWWGEYITSADNGYTWSSPRRLELPLLGPIKNKPIQLADGTLISGSSDERHGWRAHIERSTDKGHTWEFIGPLNDGKKIAAIQPAFLQHGGDTIQVLCRTNGKNGNNRIVQACSYDAGKSWSEMTETTLPNNNSGIDAVTLLDGRHLLIYNHSTRNQENMGHKGRGVINLAVSRDGINWEAALVLDYIDQPEKQYSYPSMIQTADGLVHIVYTWHRQRIKHVVVDPQKLETYPIIDGVWPTDKVPFVTSPVDAL